MKFSYLLITYLKHQSVSMDLIDNNVKKFYNFYNSIVQFQQGRIRYETTEHARIGTGHGHGRGCL